jgi:hypothetical protein
MFSAYCGGSAPCTPDLGATLRHEWAVLADNLTEHSGTPTKVDGLFGSGERAGDSGSLAPERRHQRHCRANSRPECCE